jgi:FKBP-type peptidyl-prolyl cis-trans isomerase
MRNVFFLFLMASIFTISCKKNNGCAYTESALTASSAERTYLQNYITSNAIIALEHPSGVFYTVTNPGTGANPSICSSITVKYSGALLTSGTQFDASTSASGVTFSLGQLIPGWQKVLPVLKNGGSITLYVPPSLGYGNQDVRNPPYIGNPPVPGPIIIPANSYLKFEIQLVNVQ